MVFIVFGIQQFDNICYITLYHILSANDESSRYHPMFFTHDHPFEEFFCICMQLLNKTWKEMRATSVDFSKVRLLSQSQTSDL